MDLNSMNRQSSVVDVSLQDELLIERSRQGFVTELIRRINNKLQIAQGVLDCGDCDNEKWAQMARNAVVELGPLTAALGRFAQVTPNTEMRVVDVDTAVERAVLLVGDELKNRNIVIKFEPIGDDRKRVFVQPTDFELALALVLQDISGCIRDCELELRSGAHGEVVTIKFFAPLGECGDDSLSNGRVILKKYNGGTRINSEEGWVILTWPSCGNQRVEDGQLLYFGGGRQRLR